MDISIYRNICIRDCNWNSLMDEILFRYVYLGINEESIICEVFDGKTDNSGWVEEIKNIKNIKITTRQECQKYYKNCHAKKVILIDFGNGNVKYIALTWFTNRQSEKILQTINERIEAIKQSQY